MTIIEADVDLIDQYINQELNEDQKTEFHHRLNDDSEFREQFDFISNIRLSIRESAKSEKLNMLKTIEKEDFSGDLDEFKETNNQVNRKSKIIKLRKTIYSIASVAAIGLVLVFLLPQLSEDNSKLILNENFEPYPSHVIKRSVNRNMTRTKENAYKYYSIEAYTKAIPLLQELYENGDNNSAIYLASAYIGNQRYDKAESLLNKLSPNEQYDQNVINWYLSLSYIGQDKRKNAIEKIKTLSNTENQYQDKAKKLYNELTK